MISNDMSVQRLSATKHGVTGPALLPAIANRWSPRAFHPGQPITEAQLLPLLEAARWAASCNNLQPWRLAWVLNGEPAFDRILGCLNPGNAVWAHRAAALLLGCAVLRRPDGPLNRHAVHDLGQALAQLAIQATAQGLGVHQMGGFNRDKARDALAVPEGIEPYTVVAIGWPGDPALLGEEHRAMEQAPRIRLPLVEVAPRGGWNR
jgi:nitroreductase